MSVIAAVSDIHGNLPALEAVVADIGHLHVDQVVNLAIACPAPCGRLKPPIG
jgi:hypothetical protein